jgi:hypothetical protein
MIVDEMERLLHDERLIELLNHYAQGNEQNREIWQDRVMELDGARTEEMPRLHGELLAFDWIEQNTGAAAPTVNGGVASSYRLTSGGRRALRRVLEDKAALV